MTPVVYTSSRYFLKMHAHQRRIFIAVHYEKHWRGKKILNEDTGRIIELTGIGRKKTSFGGSIYPLKCAAVLVLGELIRTAKLVYMAPPKETDPSTLRCYLNFDAVIRIDDHEYIFRLNVREYLDNHLYYNIDQVG